MSVAPGTIETLAQVKAVLNYLRPGEGKPRSYAFTPSPPNPTYEPHKVAIRDLRPVAHEFSLDCEGFALLAHRSAVTDFNDQHQLRELYYREAEVLVARATGASRVIVFDHTVRRRVPGTMDRQLGTPRQPSTVVHGDYSTRSGPQRLQEVMGEAAATLLHHRFAIINVWRPIRGPLRDAPLALCNAKSVTSGDLVAADLVYRDRVGEYLLMTYRPSHRWFYAPDMATHEALLLKCYDSAEDGRARFVPHTAFVDPTTPADVQPRESIELRTFAFW